MSPSSSARSLLSYSIASLILIHWTACAFVLVPQMAPSWREVVDNLTLQSVVVGRLVSDTPTLSTGGQVVNPHVLWLAGWQWTLAALAAQATQATTGYASLSASLRANRRRSRSWKGCLSSTYTTPCPGSAGHKRRGFYRRTTAQALLTTYCLLLTTHYLLLTTHHVLLTND